MTKIDVFSGFLGAGKTTLIKKLIAEAYAGEKLVLVENEFGEIGIDGGFMQDAGVAVTEMNSGCICCSLTGDFRQALLEVKKQFEPDRILIEPSGVGKLSDVVSAVESVADESLAINALCAVVDAGKAKMYMKNFGEFFNNQVETAGCLVLSRTAGMSEEKLAQTVALLREKNPGAVIVTTPWDELDGRQILSALERKDTLHAALEALRCEQHEEHECDDPDCACHHHHEHGGHEHYHEHEHGEHEHHHEHGEHEHHHEHGEHEHHHEQEEHCHHGHGGHEHPHHHECDDPDCACHEHGHHHHHGHDADEVFASWGTETARKFSEAALRERLEALGNSETYGVVLRAKGIVDSGEGSWLHFDYTPGEIDIRTGSAGVTGRLCVIGAHLKEEAVAALFA